MKKKIRTEVTRSEKQRVQDVKLIPEESTPFDDVYRTMLEKCRKLIIPVINECFGTDYSMDEEVVLISNEHYYIEENKILKRITDSCIRVAGHLYHIECQSTEDAVMELRMIEYDFHIALSEQEENDGERILHFPESAVMYLRGKENLPDELSVKIIFSDKSEARYKIPVIKVQNYSKEEIFDKKLLFFIPYYILKFEKQLDKIDNQEERVQEVVDEYQDIYTWLKLLKEQEFIDGKYLHDLLILTNKLIDIVARRAQNLRRKVSVMGGRVLELESDRIIAKSKAEGKAESVLLILEQRGNISEELRESILQEKDLETLNRWLILAAGAGTIEAFVEEM